MRIDCGRARGGADTHHSAMGFTLIEVLVVVAIIALLIAILLPSLIAARAEARAAVCASNEHQFGLAFMAYGVEYKGYQPRGGTYTSKHWIMLVARQVGDNRKYEHVNQVPVEKIPIFSCPERSQSLPAPFIDYVVNAFDVQSSYADGWAEIQEPRPMSDWKYPARTLLLGDAAFECSTDNTARPCPENPVGAGAKTLRLNRINHPAVMKFTYKELIANFREDLHGSLDRMDMFAPAHIQPAITRRAGTITHRRSFCNWLHADLHVERVHWLNGRRTELDWLRMFGVRDP